MDSKPSPHVVVIGAGDRKSTRLNSSHSQISYAVFCLKKKKSLNISHLVGEIRIHDIDAVRLVFPRTADSLHIRLTTQLSFSSTFERPVRHFACQPSAL